MRQDLKKVICEDGRRGSKSYDGERYEKLNRSSRHCAEAFDEFDHLESLPKHESMTKRLGWDRRTFSENLGALRGLINKNVGKNWDKVFGKLCQQVSPTGSNIERHVHQHIPDFLLTETRIGADGKVEGVSYRSWKPIAEAWVEYYVHPTTRCIVRKKNPPRKLRNHRAEEVKRRAQVCRETEDPLVQLHKLDGIWYTVKLEAYDVKSEVAKDLLVKTPVEIFEPNKYRTERVVQPTRDMKKTYGREGVRGVSRRQLSNKDLKKNGLI